MEWKLTWQGDTAWRGWIRNSAAGIEFRISCYIQNTSAASTIAWLHTSERSLQRVIFTEVLARDIFELVANHFLTQNQWQRGGKWAFRILETSAASGIMSQTRCSACRLNQQFGGWIVLSVPNAGLNNHGNLAQDSFGFSNNGKCWRSSVCHVSTIHFLRFICPLECILFFKGTTW
jgi:hypothetical protein